MKWVVKYYVLLIWGNLLKLLFRLFPLCPDTIVFDSFGGIKASCSPWYIYKGIIKDYPQFKTYWIVTDKFENTDNIPVKSLIKKGTFRYFKIIHTAKFIITNNRLDNYLCFRNKQIIINTWHGGGAFKRTFGYPKGLYKWYIDKTNQRDSNRTTYFISSSEVWSKTIARNSFGFKGEILPFGLPRNDLFFKKNGELISIVKKRLAIHNDCKIVTYAPTYRNFNMKIEDLDVQRIINALNERYNAVFRFLYRGHHSMNNSWNDSNVINVSDYSDMQELLLISDVLISDFSSCMWDFSLTRKPCFIYAPDFNDYLSNPGFESDYHEWPFVIAKSNEELVSSIHNFDYNQYRGKVDSYLKSYGSYEAGNAIPLVINIMKELSKI